MQFAEEVLGAEERGGEGFVGGVDLGGGGFCLEAGGGFGVGSSSPLGRGSGGGGGVGGGVVEVGVGGGLQAEELVAQGAEVDGEFAGGWGAVG